MAAIKTQSPQVIEKALLNPMYPRTVRIVMNRGLSIDKYTAAIVEALEPRMNGEDLERCVQSTVEPRWLCLCSFNSLYSLVLSLY